ncbi:MAG: hypothetical protein ABSB53_00230 [Nitrososphaerales archaeon]
MKRLVSAALFIMLLMLAVPAQPVAHAQTSPQLQVTSQYILNRYGYAIVNETVRYTNTGTASLTVPDISVGLGNLSSKVASYNLTGSGFKLGFAINVGVGGPYNVLGGQSLAAGANTTFMLRVILDGVVSTATNGSLQVQVLIRPSVNLTVGSLNEVVKLPASTQFATSPTGLVSGVTATSTTYSATLKNVTAPEAVLQLKTIKQASGQDFHPLVVYQAKRTISVDSKMNPVVTDQISFGNLGTTSLTTLYISPLASASGKITVLPPAVPHLLNPTSVTLNNYGITLSSAGIASVNPKTNYTLVYQYPLPQKYYNASGGEITLDLPTTAPIAAFVDSYVIGFSLPVGVKVVQGHPSTFSDVDPAPWETGRFAMNYGLSVGWGVDRSVPAASLIFVLLLMGLFVSRTAMTEEEETEEESSTERASAMIKAFDEKTNIINSVWPEVAAADPNELNRTYFDEIRGRLDTFRSRALQRLNEVKQKSTTQKFFDLLNQIHTTEREVDRATKDKLNLYEQYYTKRMRKEVFDRLLPQYSKRLERALNQLSDELHVVQREAKLL